MLLIQRNRCILTYASRQVVPFRSFSDKKDDERSKPAPYSEFVPEYKRSENPTARTTRILKNDFKRVGNWVKDKVDYFKKLNPQQKRYPVPIEAIDHFIQNREKTTMFQSHCDVLVIGGGGIGSSYVLFARFFFLW